MSPARALASGLVHNFPRAWISLGNFETRLLASRLEPIQVSRPAYVAGLARSGSTVILELLNSLPSVVSHRYCDFPPIFTPYGWNWFLERATGGQVAQPMERAHKDRIRVTSQSPEAMEEGIWMAFFQRLHDPATSNVLDAGNANPAFDRFYADHIRKLMLARGGDRYVSKGNYNVARLHYLLRLFPDARFVLPVREPAAHIASLMKQHDLFCSSLDGNSRGRSHLRRVGHFEFGPDRCPINTGDSEETARIMRLWEAGESARGWARYWSSIYGFVARQIESSKALRSACLVVRYEDLCTSPHATIEKIIAHCGLAANGGVVEAFGARLGFPDYYRWPYADRELAIIREETAEVAARFGYDAMARGEAAATGSTGS